MNGIFANESPKLRQRGFWTRPVVPITKACKVPNWQLPDDEISQDILASWLTKYPDHGIGLLMGSPFPDGTRLGAIDVDSDDYVRLTTALLGNPPCGRVGSKGIVYFVRVAGDLGNPKFKVIDARPGTRAQVAECLFRRTLCIIPPTIHPITSQAYRWVGIPLDEIDYRQLPVIGS